VPRCSSVRLQNTKSVALAADQTRLVTTRDTTQCVAVTRPSLLRHQTADGTRIVQDCQAGLFTVRVPSPTAYFFFHSLFQDSDEIGASVAPAAQNSRVRRVC